MPRPSRHSTVLRHLHDRYVGSTPDRVAALERERFSARIAREIYEWRTAAGLTQRQLASLVGTSASVICQLEDSDYDGHSLSMLRRIAAALRARVEVRFVRVAASAPKRRTARARRIA